MSEDRTNRGDTHGGTPNDGAHPPTASAASDQDVLVYYCGWDGRVKRVKPRELDQVEHGGVRARYCKTCEQMTPHAVITRAESEDAAAVVEVLVRVLNWQGVVVRRSNRDYGFYGVQVNRYTGTGWDGTENNGPRSTEAMLFGPVGAGDLVYSLQEACQVAQAPDTEFRRYRIGVGIRDQWFEARPGRHSSVMARHFLHFVVGEPADVSEPPYPPFRLFACKLRDLLSTTERQALSLVLTGRDADLDLHQVAVLQRPAAFSVSTQHVHRDESPDSGVLMGRREAAVVLW